MWQKCSMRQYYDPSTGGCGGSLNSYDWQGALAACENLVLADYYDWRLPDRNELQSIVDYSRYNPSIDTDYFSSTAFSRYWSSTADVSYTNYAWFVSFDYGHVGYYYMSPASSGFVRCVRSVPSGPFGDLDHDGDVDGKDLADFISGGTTISLEDFAANFGTN